MHSFIKKQVVGALIVYVLCLSIGISDAWSSSLDIVEHDIIIDEVEAEEMCPSPSQNSTQELHVALLDLMISVMNAVHDLRDLSDRADKVYALSSALEKEGLSLIQIIEMERSLQKLGANRHRIEELNQRLEEQDRRTERAVKEFGESTKRGQKVFADYEVWMKEQDKKEEELWKNADNTGLLVLLALGFIMGCAMLFAL